MGDCTFTCGAGYGDCNSVASDGCEVPLATSAAHCGGCGRPCGSRANAAATCAGGACAYACNAGFGDCDGDGANGCETQLSTSAQHCGACARACPAGQACGGGACAEVACYGLCEAQASRVRIQGTNVRAQRIEIAVGGTVTRFGLYVASGGRRARMALYTDARERPYALVAQTAPFTLALGRQEVQALAPAEIIAGAYWLAVQFDMDTTVAASADGSPYPVTVQDTISFAAALSNPYRVIGQSMTTSNFNLFVLVN
ncbi:MAG: hypothetical protein Q7V43_34980 [Myxococcales bacterium]|nr:hypothetical protein [Myxococcales bacterium]